MLASAAPRSKRARSSLTEGIASGACAARCRWPFSIFSAGHSFQQKEMIKILLALSCILLGEAAMYAVQGTKVYGPLCYVTGTFWVGDLAFCAAYGKPFTVLQPFRLSGDNWGAYAGPANALGISLTSFTATSPETLAQMTASGSVLTPSNFQPCVCTDCAATGGTKWPGIYFAGVNCGRDTVMLIME